MNDTEEIEEGMASCFRGAIVSYIRNPTQENLLMMGALSNSVEPNPKVERAIGSIRPSLTTISNKKRDMDEKRAEWRDLMNRRNSILSNPDDYEYKDRRAIEDQMDDVYESFSSNINFCDIEIAEERLSNAVITIMKHFNKVARTKLKVYSSPMDGFFLSPSEEPIRREISEEVKHEEGNNSAKLRPEAPRD